jgi:chromate transporter
VSAIPFREALRVWLRIGLESFGGPAGQIAVMHRVLVEERRWIGEERFLHALSYCMLLPGPEAQQLATYIGWLLHRTPGGLAAGLLFVLPGALVMGVLASLYAAFGNLPLVAALFFGIKPAVLALVLEAVLRIGRRALAHPAHVAIAAGAFVAIFGFGVPFPAIVASAAALGLVLARAVPSTLGGDAPAAAAGAAPHVDALLDGDLPGHARPDVARALRVAGLWLAIWLAPVAALVAALGEQHVFSQIALFFSKLAVVTFGGAYAVLAYIAQEAVGHYGWLAPGEMLDGLGLAETTPGPLILVAQFVGHVAAHRDPGGLPAWLAGAIGAAITLWVTFAPCFLWIFVGAPWVERLRGSRALRGALVGITAAVVGVVLNLAVWFSLHVLFARVDVLRVGPLVLQAPEWSTLSPAALAIALAAALATLRYHVSMFALLAASAAAGLAWKLVADFVGTGPA